MSETVDMTALPKDAQQRVRRAIDTARRAITGDPGLRDIYLKRFHRAMDDLRSHEEGAAVYETLSREPWYPQLDPGSDS